jgi:aldehyde:ferredoxin oxidoreductase
MKRRLLIVDTGRQSWRLETLRVEALAHDEREDYLFLYGEALCQYLLRRDASSLIVARGPMAFLAGNKATVGYLSPLTGVPHYSFVGGRAAAQLFDLGLAAIVLTGQAESEHVLVISGRAPDLDVRFEPAAELPAGQRAAYYALLEQKLSGSAEKGSVFTLGEGAGHGYLTANLAVEGIYHAGRGGAGAVFYRFARAMVLRGEPLDQGRFFASLPGATAEPGFARSPNRAISAQLTPHTTRLSGRTGGTITKLYTTGCIEQDDRTLPARNATQIGYELARLGDKRMLAATRDGQTGCHWCPVDCRHWHWVPADYAPQGRDRFLDDFEPAYAVLAMLGLIPDDPSFRGQRALLEDVNRRLFLPIEQLGCDAIDVGVGLAALFEGLERGLIPMEDVPPEAQVDASGTRVQLGDLEPAVAAVTCLRQGVDGERHPALRAIGDGPQALAERYPAMRDLVFTCGQGTLGNAGHCNALWTFLMPASRFFGHYAGQIYKIDEQLPADPDDEALRRVFGRVIARMFDRELYGILCNALSCCAFTFVMYSQDGQGERLDESDLLARTLAQYGLHTTRDELAWFAQAFWAQSMDLKARHGWRPPRADDLPGRVYEALSVALGQPADELQRWMGLLIDEWRAHAAKMLAKFGYDTTSLTNASSSGTIPR